MITKEDIGKVKEIECSIFQLDTPYLKIKSTKFECPSCGTIISVLQFDEKLRSPLRCSCGRKGGFHVVSKEVIEAQEIYVMEKGTNSVFKVYLEGQKLIDLAKTSYGQITITGEVQDEYKKHSTKGMLVILAQDIK